MDDPGIRGGASFWRAGDKKPIKKNHITEFGGQNTPEASQGQIRDVPGTPGMFGPMWTFTFKGRNVRGTDGTYDGTDGTCAQDRWDTHQGGVPPKLFMFIGLTRTKLQN